MGDVAVLGAVVAALAGVPAACAWLGRRARSRGIRGSVLAPLEEIWDPVVNRTNIELQVQVEREAPAVVPGDRLIPGRPRGQRGGG